MPQPLKTWLTKSYLTQSKNASCVLLVDPRYYDLLNNTFYLSKIYPLIRKVDPDMLSLHISAPTIADHIKEQILEFENVEMETK